MPRVDSCCCVALVVVALVSWSSAAYAQDEPPSRPKVVEPGEGDHPPADAVILLGGKRRGDAPRTAAVGSEAWVHGNGRPVEWLFDPDSGTFTIKPGTGGINSVREFGDAQIHIEFATPEPESGGGQNRGNSGVYVQARYEVQVLDSYQNDTYPNGQCAAIYGQYPPMVNVCRPPGEWQTYDIIFRAATFDASGARVQPASMTVFHNGVLVHDHAILNGGSTTASPKREGPGDGPIHLQDHGHAVRYRNIWVRPLPPRPTG